MAKCEEAQLLGHTMAADFIMQVAENPAVSKLILEKTDEIDSLVAKNIISKGTDKPSIIYNNQKIADLNNDIDNLVMASLSDNIVYQQAFIGGLSNTRLASQGDVINFVNEFKGNYKMLDKPENAIYSSILGSISSDLGLGANYVKYNYENIMNEASRALLSKAIFDYNYIKKYDFEVYAKRFYGSKYSDDITEDQMQKAFNDSESLQKKLDAVDTAAEKAEVYKNEMISRLKITDEEYLVSLAGLITDPKKAQTVSQYILIKNLLGGIGTIEDLMKTAEKIKGIPDTFKPVLDGAAVQELQDSFFSGLGNFFKMPDPEKLRFLNEYIGKINKAKENNPGDFPLMLASIFENIANYVRKGGVEDIREASQLGNAHFNVYRYVDPKTANRIAADKSRLQYFVNDLYDQTIQYFKLKSQGPVKAEDLTYTRGKDTYSGMPISLKGSEKDDFPGYINSPSDFDSKFFEILDIIGVDHRVLEVPEILDKVKNVESLKEMVEGYQKAFADMVAKESLDFAKNAQEAPQRATEYMKQQRQTLVNNIKSFIKTVIDKPVDDASYPRSVVKYVLKNGTMSDGGIAFVNTTLKNQNVDLQRSADISDADFRYSIDLPGVVNKGGYTLDDIDAAVAHYKSNGDKIGILKEIGEGNIKSIVLQNLSSITKIDEFKEIVKKIDVNNMVEKNTIGTELPFSFIVPQGKQALGFRYEKGMLTIRSASKQDIDRLSEEIQQMGKELKVEFDNSPEANAAYEKLYKEALAVKFPDATEEAIQNIRDVYHSQPRHAVNARQRLVYSVSDGAVSETEVSMKQTRADVKKIIDDGRVREEAQRIIKKENINADMSKYKLPEDMALLEETMLEMKYSKTLLEKDAFRVKFLQQIGVVGNNVVQYGDNTVALAVDTMKYMEEKNGIRMPSSLFTNKFRDWFYKNKENIPKLLTEDSAFFVNIPEDISDYIYGILGKNPAFKVENANSQSFYNALSNISQAIDDVKNGGMKVVDEPVDEIIYRGQGKDFVNLQKIADSNIYDNILTGKGIFTTNNKEVALTYGENLFSFKKPKKSEKILDLGDLSDNDIERLGLQKLLQKDTFEGSFYERYKKNLASFKKSGSLLNKNIAEGEDTLFRYIGEEFSKGESLDSIIGGYSVTQGKGVSIDEYRNSVLKKLRSAGYNFIKHKGGIRTDDVLHDVYIALDDNILEPINEVAPRVSGSDLQVRFVDNTDEAYYAANIDLSKLDTEKRVENVSVKGNIKRLSSMIEDYKARAKDYQDKAIKDGADWIPGAEDLKRTFQDSLDRFETEMISEYRGYIFNTTEFRGNKSNILIVDQEPGLVNFNKALDNIESVLTENLNKIQEAGDKLQVSMKENPQKFREDAQNLLLTKGEYQMVQNGNPITISVGVEAKKLQGEVPYGLSKELDALKNTDISTLDLQEQIGLYKIMNRAKTISRNKLPISAEGVRGSLNPLLGAKFYEDYAKKEFILPDVYDATKSVSIPKKIGETNNFTPYIQKARKDDTITGISEDLLIKQTIFDDISKAVKKGERFDSAKIVEAGINKAAKKYNINLKNPDAVDELNAYKDSLKSDFEIYESITALKISPDVVNKFGDRLKLDYEFSQKMTDEDRVMLNRFNIDGEGMGDFTPSDPATRANFPDPLASGKKTPDPDPMPKEKVRQINQDRVSIDDFWRNTDVETVDASTAEQLWKQSRAADSGTVGDAMRKTKKTLKLFEATNILFHGDVAGGANRAFITLSKFAPEPVAVEIDLAKKIIEDPSLLDIVEGHPEAKAIAKYFITLQDKVKNITGDAVFDGAIDNIGSILDKTNDMEDLARMVLNGNVIEMAKKVDPKLNNMNVGTKGGYDAFKAVFGSEGERFMGDSSYKLIMDKFGSPDFSNWVQKKAKGFMKFSRVAIGFGPAGWFNLATQFPAYIIQIASSIAKNGSIDAIPEAIKRTGFLEGSIDTLGSVSRGDYKMLEGVNRDTGNYETRMEKIWRNLNQMGKNAASAPLINELGGGVQQVADIIFRPLVQRISFLEALRSSPKKFDSAEDFIKRFDDTPQSLEKQQIVDAINVEGSRRYTTNVGFGVGGEAGRSNRGVSGMFRTIFNFKGTRGENIQRFFLRDTFGPIGFGVKFFAENVLTKGGKSAKQTINELSDFYSNNYEFQYMRSTMYLNMKYLGHLRQLEDEPGKEETVEGEFLKMVKAVSRFSGQLIAFSTNAIGRQELTFLSSAIQGESLGKIASDNLGQLMREPFKFFKPTDAIANAILIASKYGYSDGLKSLEQSRERLGDGVLRYFSDKGTSNRGSDYVPMTPLSDASYYMSDVMNTFKQFNQSASEDTYYEDLLSVYAGEKSFLDRAKYRVLQSLPLLTTIEKATSLAFGDGYTIKEQGLSYEDLQKDVETDPTSMDFFDKRVFDVDGITDQKVKTHMEGYIWRQLTEKGVAGKGTLIALIRGYQETGKTSNPFVKTFIESVSKEDLDKIVTNLLNIKGEAEQATYETQVLIAAAQKDTSNVPGASRMILDFVAERKYSIALAEYKKRQSDINKLIKGKADDEGTKPNQGEDEAIKRKIINDLMPLLYKTDRPGMMEIYGEYIITKFPEYKSHYDQTEAVSTVDKSTYTQSNMHKYFKRALYIETSFQMCLAKGEMDCMNIKSLFNDAGNGLEPGPRMHVINNLFKNIDTTNKTLAEKTDLKLRILDANPDLIPDIKNLKATFPEIADEFILGTYGAVTEASDLAEGAIKESDMQADGKTSTIGGNLKASVESFKGLYDAIKGKMNRQGATFSSLNKDNVKPTDNKRGIPKQQRAFLKDIADQRDILRASGGAGATSDRIVSAKPAADIKRAPTFKAARKPRTGGAKAKKTSKRSIGR